MIEKSGNRFFCDKRENAFVWRSCSNKKLSTLAFPSKGRRELAPAKGRFLLSGSGSSSVLEERFVRLVVICDHS
jgi:hypothetical protein